MDLIAHAKINWNLKILGKRPDGFHELDTVMTSIGLCDHLSISASEMLQMTCNDPSLPTDDRNLVIKAAKALASEAGITPKASIHVEKNIPAGGGLGGGSSDAASTLLGLNTLWELHWPIEKLAPIAAQLGSDIPFFLWGGWCRCTGRGEIVKPLEELNQGRQVPLLLILPSVHIETPKVYQALQAPALSAPKVDTSLTALYRLINIQIDESYRRNPVPHWPDNGLMRAAATVSPVLAELHRYLQELFPGRWQMSGSGAVHYVTLTTEELKGEAVKNRLLEQPPCELRLVETATIHPSLYTP